MIRNLVLIVSCAFFSNLGAVPASACVCALLKDPTPAQIRAQMNKEYDDATLIFSGRVVALNAFRAKFLVEQVWKGEKAAQIVMLTGTKQNADGTITMSSCDYKYYLGGRYLVYARGEELGLITYQCTGTGLYKDSAESLKFLDAIARRERGKGRFYRRAKSNNGMHPTRLSAAFMREAFIMQRLVRAGDAGRYVLLLPNVLHES